MGRVEGNVAFVTGAVRWQRRSHAPPLVEAKTRSKGGRL